MNHQISILYPYLKTSFCTQPCRMSEQTECVDYFPIEPITKKVQKYSQKNMLIHEKYQKHK